MFVPYSFNKTAPVVEGTIFETIGSMSIGFAIFIENQDSANTLVYHFESSTDGIEYEVMEFPVGSGTGSHFAVLPGEVHLLKITSSDPRVRMVAHGDLDVGLHISTYKTSNTGTPAVNILF